ncbi:MAG TPA: PEP-CTERM sorting domain-containing protein, partial [Gammaproteobacteria bacterium]|nr:PEP-CTERM sorting domain-containing protein [Gammaproteobacteria bacterium]
NIDGPSLDFEIDFSQTLVTVDYQFSAVPVPAAAWLFMSGLIGLAAPAMRRRL